MLTIELQTMNDIIVLKFIRQLYFSKCMVFGGENLRYSYTRFNLYDINEGQRETKIKAQLFERISAKLKLEIRN